MGFECNLEEKLVKRLKKIEKLMGIVSKFLSVMSCYHRPNLSESDHKNTFLQEKTRQTSQKIEKLH